MKRRSRGFWAGLLVVGVYCLLHLLNDCRVGFLDPRYELGCLLRVVQTPVLCLCLIRLIRDEKSRDRALGGVLAAALLTGLGFLLARITGTGNVTYGEGLGYSGWVIDDNRCANSILLVTLSAFCLYHARITGKNWLAALIPPAVGLALFTNGTKTCYFGLFVLCGGFACFLLLERLLLREKLRTMLLCSLILTMTAAAALYPFSPRFRVDAELGDALTRERESLSALSAEYEAGSRGEDGLPRDAAQRRAYLDRVYRRCLGSFPELFRRFGMERVQRLYGYTTDPTVLRDARRAERSFARLLWEDSDALTKLLGFECSLLGTDGHYDLENDWPALFYCYGILGFGLYAGFVLVFVLRILRSLRRDFRGSLTPLNFTLALCLALQLGLAQYSGALLRRPNVSVYLALVLALIWLQTRERA